MDGLECLALAKQRAPELKVIVLSAYAIPSTSTRPSPRAPRHTS